MILCHRTLGLSDFFEDGTKSINELGLGGTTDTGMNLNADKALQYHAVWKAVNLIGSSVARTPCHLYRRVPGGKERDMSMPGAFLVLRQPAPGVPPAPYYMAVMGHVLLHGNHYTYINRDGSGNPVELWPLDPRRVTPVLADGIPMYVYQSKDTGYRKLFYDDVIHVRGLGFDGLAGYSVIRYMKNCLAQGLSAEKYTSKFFANSAEARVVITTPNDIDEETAARLKASWDSMHKGLDNSHKTAVLSNGMDIKTLSISARDAQLIESMQLNIRAVANWFMMPPHKLGDNSRTAYNSIEAENQAFLDEAIDYWLVVIEQEFSAKLLAEKQFRADSHFYEFERKALVRANLQTRALYYRQASAGAPWMTINEIRAAENMNPVDIGSGIIMPTNNFGERGAVPGSPPPASEPPAGTRDNQPEVELAHAVELAYNDAVRRMQTRAEKAYKSVRAKQPDLTPDAARSEVSLLHFTIMHEHIYPSARALAMCRQEDPDKLTTGTVKQIIQKLGD